jgi:hypothetical protein
VACHELHTLLGAPCTYSFFFPPIDSRETVPAHCTAGISYRYITPINCVQRRLGWEAGYRITLRYQSGTRIYITSTTDLSYRGLLQSINPGISLSLNERASASNYIHYRTRKMSKSYQSTFHYHTSFQSRR